MNKLLNSVLMLIIGASAGAGVAYWFNQHETDTRPVSAITEHAKNKPLFYRNPMNPDITSPVPAQDEMGMDYIPVYAENPDSEGKAPAGTVLIDPVTVQNIGVRTTEAQIKALSHNIRTVGKVSYDEERISRLHPKTEGWIEKLFIDKTGTTVKKNTMLLSIYSPQLVTSTQEYLLALKSAETLKNSPFEDIRISAQQMASSARERLQLLDVPAHQIHDLETTGKIQKALHIHSPFDGTVINIGVREGQYVTPQTELYMLADLSKVWVIAQVYESDFPWVAEGDPVEMQLTALPGKTFRGHVSYIYPYAEAKTRTIQVRLAFDNPELLLKPDMFANVTIKTKLQDNAVTVPSEAIIRSGQHEQVFVVRGPGKYEPRKVQTGLVSAGYTQILQGIEAGEQVVASSQFLIDSESKLRESTAKMLEALQDNSLQTDSMEMNTTPVEMNNSDSESQMTNDSANSQMNNTAAESVMEHHHHD